MNASYPALPHIASLAEGLVSRRFPAAMIPETALSTEVSSSGAGGEVQPDEATAGFLRVVQHGFYEGWPSEAEMALAAQVPVKDGCQFTGVYADSGSPALQPWGEALQSIGFDPQIHPVGTFCEYDKTLNAGGRAPIPARLVTDVTVNPSFRRRGILSHLMTSALARAVQQEQPVMALTASEGAIYGRFGFGPSTRVQSVHLNISGAGDSFALRTPATGRVLPVDPAKLDTVITETFAAHHATTRGSVGRHAGYRELATARWNPEEITTSWAKARAVAHIDDRGRIDGYAVFTFDGWEKSPKTMRVRELITADDTSALEIYRHLAQMDLVERISLPRGTSVDDPLRWALVNPRARTVTGEHDVLWLRILDVVQALEGREWGEDGTFLLSVTDPLSIASGSWKVTVSDGRASLQEETSSGSRDCPKLQIDVETLAVLYLGDASVQSLHRAGRITAAEDQVAALGRILDLSTRPWCATYF